MHSEFFDVSKLCIRSPNSCPEFPTAGGLDQRDRTVQYHHGRLSDSPSIPKRGTC